MTHDTHALDVFHAAARRLQDGDIDGYLDLCADDIRYEFPFAPDPAPRLIEGKDALGVHIRRRAGLLKAPRIVDQEVYVTDHPGTVISETRLEDASGTTRAAIAVATVLDGHISAYRDYFNPLDVTKAPKPRPSGDSAERPE